MSGKTGDVPILLPSGTIRRATLVKKMKEKSLKKSIFITAPSGYGKSIAAAQWLSVLRGATTKLTLGDEDNDPSVFYRRLATSLAKLVLKKTNPKNESSPGGLDGLLRTLRVLPEKNARCYMVLDDLYMIKNDEILDNLAMIMNRTPDYVCMCIISRSAPPASFLDSGRFEIITQEELLFTREEIEWLGVEKDRNLSEEQVENLHELTGGWAIYLSALLSNDDAWDSMPGRARQTLSQYFRMRVLELWDDETKLMMLRLALPSEVTPELCERLTQRGNGRGILKRIVNRENAFLSFIGRGIYRFHDLFRDFLLDCAKEFLDEDEIRRLNAVTADWYYERGDYIASAKHYIQNKDHEGINRCLRAINRFNEEAGSMSVDVRVNFMKRHVWNLAPEFITENPYLVSKCAVMAFHIGATEDFLRYEDMLFKRMPVIADEYPDLMENAVFTILMDFRIPFSECLKRFASKALSLMPIDEAPTTEAPTTEAPVPAALPTEAHITEAQSPSITQNLPFFHRSTRDFSEYFELGEADVALLKNTIGAIIGKDYTVMEESLFGGVYYERGELLKAARHCLDGYHICSDDMQPETIFCSHMILSAVLDAMGSTLDANGVLEITENFIKRKAQFLYPNFKAVQTSRAIRAGDTEAAREWLTISANRSVRLPFYQITRHFTTMRSYIAVGDFAEAIDFGKRLQALAVEYKRPLDQIESDLLTAIALARYGDKIKAIDQLERAVVIAMTYGFKQLFINEGNDALSLLWELRERKEKNAAVSRFVDKLTNDIYVRLNLSAAEKPPKLTSQQCVMLSRLSEGMSYNEIAKASGIGRATVKSHVLLLYKRLGVHNAAEAVTIARMKGLLKP